MAFIPTLNAADWAMDFDLEGRGWTLTGAASCPGGASISVLTSIATVLHTWWSVDAKGGCVSLNCLTETRATDVSSISGPVVHLPLSTPECGSPVEEALPIQSAMVVTKQSMNRGRSFRGRFYMSGLPVSALTSATEFNNGTQVFWNLAFQALITKLNTNGTPLAVISLHNGGAPRASGLVVPITAVRANLRIGSQRRRTGR